MPFTVKACSNLIVSSNVGFGLYHFTQAAFALLSFHIINVEATLISNLKSPVPIKGYTWKLTFAPVYFLNTPINQKYITA